jgi:UDP-N-acetylglucosamine--N-acetylmuramyl-(pentapeptide) pyrophosphoryl-undecaprenol N-acetylglucosamine transferase
MHILFSGGGTGGGVYPALAVLAALKQQHPGAQVLWMGSTHGPERDLVEREGIDYCGVPGGPLVGVGLRAVPGAVKIALGVLKALGIVRRFRPDALLLTGGWATIPAALACRLLRVPLTIYMPDIEPGSTIRALARLSRRVAVTGETSARHFRPGQAVVTGYPLRASLLAAAGFDALGAPLPGPSRARAQALDRFELVDGLPVLLVFGGSAGAQSINQALTAALPELLPRCQVIHIAGRRGWPEIAGLGAKLVASLPEEQASRYHSFEYLHSEDMALALAAADLVVSRAGASTLGEFPLFDLPAILVPYPHAWRYQKTNADYLVNQGAAMRLDDDKLRDNLVPLIEQTLFDAATLARLSSAAGALKQPGAAARIAALLVPAAAGLPLTPES